MLVLYVKVLVLGEGVTVAVEAEEDGIDFVELDGCDTGKQRCGVLAAGPDVGVVVCAAFCEILERCAPGVVG
jgi:hypothetical protein